MYTLTNNHYDFLSLLGYVQNIFIRALKLGEKEKVHLPKKFLGLFHQPTKSLIYLVYLKANLSVLLT